MRPFEFLLASFDCFFRSDDFPFAIFQHSSEFFQFILCVLRSLRGHFEFFISLNFALFPSFFQRLHAFSGFFGELAFPGEHAFALPAFECESGVVFRGISDVVFGWKSI